MTVDGQLPVTYSYDANGNLTQIIQGTQTVTATHDALGRRVLLALPNGVSTEYVYDTASRLTGLIYGNTAGVLGDLRYTYDAAGNRVALGGSFARTLLPDPVLNATYNAANEQLAFSDKTMTFDANGDLETVTGPSGITTLTWDARKRLVGLIGPGLTALFRYDAFDRRLTKEINGQITQYQYDRFDVVKELFDGTPVNSLRTLNVDELLIRNGTQHHLADALGSSIALTDPTGTVQTEYTYEPFGRTAVAGAATNPIQYTGRENDGTSLYYYRSRYYNPSLHRFISEDPLQFGGGDINFYAYVAGDPITLTDPQGEGFVACVAASAVGGAVIEGGLQVLTNFLSGRKSLFEGVGAAALRGAGEGALLGLTCGIAPALKALSGAAKVQQVILPYREAAKLTRGLRNIQQAHHILEARHLRHWGRVGDIAKAPAVVLSRTAHQALTNELRRALPYGTQWTPQQVWRAYQRVYRDFPAYLRAIESYFK